MGSSRCRRRRRRSSSSSSRFLLVIIVVIAGGRSGFLLQVSGGPPSPPVTTTTARDKNVVIMELYESEELVPSFHSGNGSSSSVPHWSYSDGSTAVSPSRVTTPDEWEWINEWKLVTNGGMGDSYGWCYGRDFASLSKDMKDGKGRNRRYRRDACRRRLWVRSLRPTARRAWAVEEDDSLLLAAAGSKNHTAEGAVAVKLEEASFLEEFADSSSSSIHPQAQEEEEDEKSKVLSPAFWVDKCNQVRQWLSREFVFRGWGIGFVKPAASLLSRDAGVGLRLPLSSNFRSWHANRSLPMITSNLFVSWPPCIQGGIHLSYPIERLRDGVRFAFRSMVAGPGDTTTAAELLSKSSTSSSLSSPERKQTVRRLGLSIGLAYSMSGGFRWWMSPTIFIRPGLRVIIKAIRGILLFIVPSRSSKTKSSSDQLGEPRRQRPITPVRRGRITLRKISRWAGRKSSGIGYSLVYHRNGLRSSLMLDFQPIFLPLQRKKRTSQRAPLPTEESTPASTALASSLTQVSSVAQGSPLMLEVAR